MALNITTGQMRTTAILQNNTPIPDGAGGFLDNFSNTCTMRGRLRQLSGGRVLEQAQAMSDQLYEFVTRAQSAIVLNSDSQVLIEGIPYRVSSWKKVDEIEHYFVFKLAKCLTDLT